MSSRNKREHGQGPNMDELWADAMDHVSELAPPYSPGFTGCPAVELAIRRLYQAGEKEREDCFWALIKGLNYALQMQTNVLAAVETTPAQPRTQTSWAGQPIRGERARGLPLWTVKTSRGRRLLPVFTNNAEADASPATLGLPIAELPLQQVMKDALGRGDLMGIVINPWGRSAMLDKGLLRGLLYAKGPDAAPGEAETRQGCQLSAEGQWEQAAALFAKGAEAGFPEGMRRLGGCYAAGRGVRRDRRRALSLWRQAAAAGDVQAQIALGDSYTAGTSRTPGDPGRGLMAYRRARAMAEQEMDLTTWPSVCLRMAEAEAGKTGDIGQRVRLLAEAVHGLSLLCKEQPDPEADAELRRAFEAQMDLLLDARERIEKLQKLKDWLDAHGYTKSSHLD